MISIHAPLTGSDPTDTAVRISPADFNPRSPYGERPWCLLLLEGGIIFQSTLHLRGATQPISPEAGVLLISIHAPLTGSDNQPDEDDGLSQISIHAPLTGSDPFPHVHGIRNSDFNPRSPYGERPHGPRNVGRDKYFNPRSPYGERQHPLIKCAFLWNFNPRSPYGERQSGAVFRFLGLHFNPRSPYGERHWSVRSKFLRPSFQSTLPLRGATQPVGR